MTTITASAKGYTAEMDPETNRVEISDREAHLVGEGKWDGYSIECPANLGDRVYKALDEALSDAIADAAELDSYHTTYSDGRGHYSEAVQISWARVEEILGHAHQGTPEDDGVMRAYLRKLGAESWVLEAAGWTDDAGWGLIGPETVTYAVLGDRVWGTGSTPVGARVDAREWMDVRDDAEWAATVARIEDRTKGGPRVQGDCLALVRITPALRERVEERGGDVVSERLASGVYGTPEEWEAEQAEAAQ